MVKLSKDRKRELEKQVDKDLIKEKEREYKKRYKQYRQEGGFAGVVMKGIKGTMKLTKKALDKK